MEADGGVMMGLPMPGASANAPGAPPSPPPAPNSVADSSSAGGPSAAPSLRTKFVTTPFFAERLLVDASGSLHFTYTLPDDIATFEIRAYAIASDNAFGQGKVDQISRRPLSIQSAAPKVSSPPLPPSLFSSSSPRSCARAIASSPASPSPCTIPTSPVRSPLKFSPSASS